MRVTRTRVATLMPWLLLLALCLLPVLAFAAPGAPTTPLPDINVGKIGGAPVSLPLQTLLLMTAITLIPSMLLVLTSFTRIIIVLGLLRQALGTGQTPSNQVLLGLALFLTAMVMMPTWDKAWSAGMAPYLNGEIDFQTAWTLTTTPLRGFMLAQIRETDLMTFAGIAGHGTYASPDAIPFPVLGCLVRHQRAEDRLRDRLPDLHSVRDHRPGRGQRADVDGHDDAVADAGVGSVQDPAVRAGGWLGADRGYVGGQLQSGLISLAKRSRAWLDST